MTPLEFLPERIRTQRQRRARLVRRGYLLALCVLAMVGLSYARHGRLNQARGQLVQFTDRAEDMQRQVAKIQPLEQQMADLLIKKRIDEELGSRTDCTAVLSELCRLLPPNMSLISVELRTVEIPLDRKSGAPAVNTGTSPRLAGAPVKSPEMMLRRVRLMITGLAPTDVDVANFIGQMSACPLFEDVNMGYAKGVTFRNRSAREFQASCYLMR